MRNRRLSVIGLLAGFVAMHFATVAAQQPDEALAQESRRDLEQADPFMGDWQGYFRQRNRKTSAPLVAQVVALGKGRYHATLLPAFDQRTMPVASLEGQRDGDFVRFFGWGDVSSYCGPDWEGVIEGDRFRGSVPAREGGTFELEKVVRVSPTLGAQPPAGAVVLFDGSNLDAWEKRQRLLSAPAAWKIENSAMEVTRGGGSIQTRQKFENYRLHVEFRTPLMAEAREQSRANSGVYCHNTEVQVLDTYGLAGRSLECGGIYHRRDPLVNMCRPPRQWQTYDITVETPEGANSVMTVAHNGVVIHERLDLGRRVQPTSILLQDHGNAVQYRNIWLVERR